MKFHTFLEDHLLSITLISLGFALVKEKGMTDKLILVLSIVVTYIVTGYCNKKVH
jgi:hypothetical protein